jgi:hypothetical protein
LGFDEREQNEISPFVYNLLVNLYLSEILQATISHLLVIVSGDEIQLLKHKVSISDKVRGCAGLSHFRNFLLELRVEENSRVETED